MTTTCSRGHPYDEANTRVRSDGSRQCRRCASERRQQRYWGDPQVMEQQRKYDRARTVSRSNERYQRLYGQTRADLEGLLEEQQGCCACCGTSGSLHPVGGGRSPGKRLVVDHCHKAGGVRGLLCDRCNKTLGHVKDDPALLERLANYLRAPVRRAQPS